MSTDPAPHPVELAAAIEERLRALETAVAERDAFIYAISHDLKSHLQVVLGFANHLVTARAAEFSPDVLEYLKTIESYAQRIEGRIGDLLTLARLETGEEPTRAIELDPAVRRAIEGLGPRIREGGVRVEYRPASTSARVRAHPALIEIIVANLVENAIKYADRSRPDSYVLVEERQADSMACVCVEDNGLGIEAEALAQLFESGERHHARIASGTGLGLLIVRRIQQNLGGSIAVTSQPGQGSRFEVLLPLAPSDSDQ